MGVGGWRGGGTEQHVNVTKYSYSEWQYHGLGAFAAGAIPPFLPQQTFLQAFTWLSLGRCCFRGGGVGGLVGRPGGGRWELWQQGERDTHRLQGQVTRRKASFLFQKRGATAQRWRGGGS